MLGLYVSDHPLVGAEAALRRHTDCTILDLREDSRPGPGAGALGASTAGMATGTGATAAVTAVAGRPSGWYGGRNATAGWAVSSPG